MAIASHWHYLWWMESFNCHTPPRLTQDWPFCCRLCRGVHTATLPARCPGSTCRRTRAPSGWSPGNTPWRGQAETERLLAYSILRTDGDWLTMSSGPSQECLNGRSSGTILLSIISMSSRTSGSQFSLMARDALVWSSWMCINPTLNWDNSGSWKYWTVKIWIIVTLSHSPL